MIGPRRLDFIDAALEPVTNHLPPDEWFLIRRAVALEMGGSIVTALVYTCAPDPDQAARLAAFAATVIAEHAQRPAGP